MGGFRPSGGSANRQKHAHTLAHTTILRNFNEKHFSRTPVAKGLNFFVALVCFVFVIVRVQ